MKIYCISLLKDCKRKEQIKLIFFKSNKKIDFIDAIYGKKLSASDYFSYLHKYYLKNNKILTPSELGCTLSHINTLKDFLIINNSHALILEDDVIGNDEDILRVEKISKSLPVNSIVILGGQQGLGFNKYIFGKSQEIKNLYKIPRFSMKFIARSCCYLIDKNAAKNMVYKLEKNLDVIDHWHKIFSKSNINFYYYPIFSHPIELKESNIEKERAVFYIDSFWKRLIKYGIFKKILNRFFNDMGAIYTRLNGYKKIEDYESIRKD